MENTRPLPRLAELDALRGIAAGLVVLFHYTWQVQFVYPAAKPISHGLFWGGYGVELFFAISGFVIFMTLDRTGQSLDFVVSRFSRLFPAYWAGMLLTSAAVLLLGAPSLAQPAWVIATNVTMLQGYFYLPSVDGVYWTLTVELSFYLGMLALWRVGLLDRIEAVLMGWLSLKLLWWLVPGLPTRIGLILVQSHIPYFAIGIAAYRLWQGKRSLAQQVPVLIWGMMIMLVTDQMGPVRAYTAVAAVFALLISGRLGWLKIAPLLWLGSISYPLYLIHQFFGFALMAKVEALGSTPPVALLLTLAATLALAHMIHVLVETPAQTLIRQAWRGRSRLVAVSIG